MEHRHPHEIANRLLEARAALRSHNALEKLLIERISVLPEDDFCHIAREAFQMGAGYAYQQREHEGTSLEDVFTSFFATQPRNRYLDPEVIELERKKVSHAALQLLETGMMPELEGHLDPYQVEAAAAFTEGYLVVADIVSSRPNEIEAT